MNKIYKVIWSKAKHCYIVASEIAKSHSKSGSATGMKKLLLATLAAATLTCTGFVGASAADTVTVDEHGSASSATAEVYTTAGANDKFATKTDLDDYVTTGTASATYAAKTDVTTLQTLVGTDENSGLRKDVNDLESDVSDLKTAVGDTYTKNEVDNKLSDYVTTTALTSELDDKAEKDLSNMTSLSIAGETVIKTALADDFADKSTTYTKTETDTAITTATKDLAAKDLSNVEVSAFNTKLNSEGSDFKTLSDAVNDTSTGLATKASQEDLNTATGKITTLETTVGNSTSGLVKDVADLQTSVATKISKEDATKIVNQAIYNSDEATAQTGSLADTIANNTKTAAAAQKTADDLKTDLYGTAGSASTPAEGSLAAKWNTAATTATQNSKDIDALEAKTEKISYSATDGTKVDSNLTTTGSITSTGTVTASGFKVEGTNVSIDKTTFNVGNMKLANVADGNVTATSKQGVNGSQLYKEQEERKEADETLQTNIDAVKKTADDTKAAIENETTGLAAAHTKAEKAQLAAETADGKAVKAQEAADTNAKAIETLKTSVSDETSAREQAVKDLKESISDVDKKAETAKTDAAAAKTIAETAKTTADAASLKVDGLETSLTTNYYTQAETNAQIKTAVDNEATARDTAISTAITNEIDARNTAINAAIATEVANRDTAISTAIKAEENARDTAILDAKTDLQQKITDEATTRKDADDELKQAIKTETDARTDADTKLNAAIQAEAQARKDADDALSERITTNETDIDALEKKTEGIDRTQGTDGTNYTVISDKLIAKEDATFQKDVTVEGTTTTKTLDVRENATIGGTLEVTGTSTFKDKATFEKGLDANGQTITGVGDGKIEADSKEAVNGGQVYTIKTELQTNIDNEAKARADADQVLSDRIGAQYGDGNYIKDSGGTTGKGASVYDNLRELDNALKDTDDRTAGITRDDENNTTTIEGKVTVDKDGNISNVNTLNAKDVNVEGTTTTTTLDVKENATIGKDLTVEGKSNLKGDTTIGTEDSNANLTVNGNSTVTGDSTVGGDLDVKGDATVEKDLTVKGDATVDGDLTVKGDLNVNKIHMENTEKDSSGNEHNSYTDITADGMSNKAEVKDSKGITTTSKFTHDVTGTTTYDKTGNSENWKETTTEVNAGGVHNHMADSDKNSNDFTQTSTTTESVIKDKEGNTSTSTQTATNNKSTIEDGAGNKTSTNQSAEFINTYAKDEDGNKSYTAQEGDRIASSVIGKDGKTTSEMTTTDITNTATNGTITNDAKDLVNNASGNITNTAGGTLTNKANEIINESKGDTTNIVGGDLTNTVTGDIKNSATNITNEASESITNQVNKTTTKVEDGKISEEINDDNGNHYDSSSTATDTHTYMKSDTNESYSGQQAGGIGTIVKDTVNGTQTSTEQTGKDITNKAEDGTITNTAKDLINKATEKILSQVEDSEGNVVAKTEMDKDGNIANEAKGNITNTAEGDIKNSATNISNEASESITNKVNNTTTKVEDGKISEEINDGENHYDSSSTATDSHTYMKSETHASYSGQQADGIGTIVKDTVNGTQTSTEQTGKDITNKAEDGTITNTAKDLINKATEKILSQVEDSEGNVVAKTEMDKDGNITNTAEGDIKNSASNITNEASESISNKVGDNTSQVMEDKKITTRVDGDDGVYNEIIQKDTVTKNTVTDGTNTALSRVKADEIKNRVDGENGSGVSKVTESGVVNKAESADGTARGQIEVTTDAITSSIKDGTNYNSVVSTVDAGTTFSNSAANAPITENGKTGEATTTTIKGNTISTGKATMDFAEVLKDLGVRGDAVIDGNTKTGSLNVVNDAEIGGNATVKKDLTVEGKTNLKGDTTIGTETQSANLKVYGDASANSFNVNGTGIKLDSNGLNMDNHKITNVADGDISLNSKDAVNGGQLYKVREDLNDRVDRVGANAAAMANLRPMEYDSDSKWSLAGAIGNYGSETAAAIGAFFRPNEDVSFNVSTTLGTGENMVGGGVSVRLGKGGGKKMSKAEADALKAQVNSLTARMDALLSVLNPNMSQDFPDVPENHWAYEAVSRLAGNGIVEGYPDGEFHGERTMTRYEMAEIIYNALSQGAQAEKDLVEEFKPELQAMAASQKASASDAAPAAEAPAATEAE